MPNHDYPHDPFPDSTTDALPHEPRTEFIVQIYGGPQDGEVYALPEATSHILVCCARDISITNTPADFLNGGVNYDQFALPIVVDYLAIDYVHKASWVHRQWIKPDNGQP